MLKICPALQNMDASLCPFCNSECNNSVDACCNHKVLELSGAVDKIKQIASGLIKNNIH